MCYIIVNCSFVLMYISANGRFTTRLPIKMNQSPRNSWWRRYIPQSADTETTAYTLLTLLFSGMLYDVRCNFWFILTLSCKFSSCMLVLHHNSKIQFLAVLIILVLTCLMTLIQQSIGTRYSTEFMLENSDVSGYLC